MPWPVFTPNDKHKASGAGFLLGAPEGTPLPTFTVSGGKFTNSWDAAWKQLGRTSEDGINITHGQESASFTSAQEQEPFITKVTSKSNTIAFTLYDYNQFNIQMALNGGNWSISGSGSNQIAEYIPAGPGEETYTMLAWLGPSDDEVKIFYKCLSTAEVSMDMTRDDPRPLALTMTAIVPAISVSPNKKPYRHLVAGTSFNNS